LLFRLIAGFLTVAVLAVGSPAPAAAEGFLSAPALWAWRNIYLDGDAVNLRDAAGNPVQPFIRETELAYLPLRATAEAFGWTVGWDAEAGGVTIDTLGKPAVFPAEGSLYNESYVFDLAVTAKQASVMVDGKALTLGENDVFVYNGVIFLSVEVWARDILDLSFSTGFPGDWANAFVALDTPAPIAAPETAGTTVPVSAPTVTAPAPAVPVMDFSSMTYEECEAYALEMVRLTNIERVKAGLNEVKVSLQLMEAAQAKAEDLVANNYFAHFRAPYRNYLDMMYDTIAKYWPEGKYIGENLIDGGSPAGAVKVWMNSPGHRANILNPKHRYVGVGVARRPGVGNGCPVSLMLGY
jgi:uncharacterized protein YkwD